MNLIQRSFYKTKIGELVLASFEDRLCLLDFRYRKMRQKVDDRIATMLGAEFEEQETDVIKFAKQQLDEYLLGKRKAFDVPVRMVGTGFQVQVWHTLQTIGYGETASYLTLANKLEDPKAVRAVAAANGANGLAIIVPCHRIIGSKGDLVGYGGGIRVKQQLLQLEAPDLFAF